MRSEGPSVNNPRRTAQGCAPLSRLSNWISEEAGHTVAHAEDMGRRLRSPPLSYPAGPGPAANGGWWMGNEGSGGREVGAGAGQRAVKRSCRCQEGVGRSPGAMTCCPAGAGAVFQLPPPGHATSRPTESLHSHGVSICHSAQQVSPEDQYLYYGGMRRKWVGSPNLFKALMDKHSKTYCGDNLEDGMTRVPSREGELLVWKHSELKGAVLLTMPSGEVCCQGNEEQQRLFYDILTQFTDPWDQKLEMTKGGRQLLAAESRGETSEAPKLITAGPQRVATVDPAQVAKR